MWIENNHKFNHRNVVGFYNLSSKFFSGKTVGFSIGNRFTYSNKRDPSGKSKDGCGRNNGRLGRKNSGRVRGRMLLIFFGFLGFQIAYMLILWQKDLVMFVHLFIYLFCYNISNIKETVTCIPLTWFIRCCNPTEKEYLPSGETLGAFRTWVVTLQ